MIGPGEVMIALIVIGLPTTMLGLAFRRFFRLKEKQLEVDAMAAAEKAAQYASRSTELEAGSASSKRSLRTRALKPRPKSKHCAIVRR